MISVVILTFNEAGNLPRCLDSVRFSDDVLVLDSGSTDDTCRIALEHGARVMTRAFDTFAKQRNHAMEQGELIHPWVLHLDADEVVPPELRAELEAVANAPGDMHAAFRIPSKLIFMGRWLRHSGMYPSYQVRFGQRGQLRFVDHGHGQREALPAERIGTLSAAFDHHNFSKGINDWFARHLRYAAAESAQALAEREQVLTLADLFKGDPTRRRRALKRVANRLPFRPTLRFAYVYLLRAGFLDGIAGYRYARMLAMYQYFIDLNMAELRAAAVDAAARDG